MRAANPPPTTASRKGHDQGVREHRIDTKAVAHRMTNVTPVVRPRASPRSASNAAAAAEVEGRRGTEHSTARCRGDAVPTEGSAHVFIDGVAFAPTRGKQTTPLGNLVSCYTANEILKINFKCQNTSSGERRIV